MIFLRWVRDFVVIASQKYGLQDWLVMFYDAFRVQMSHGVINTFRRNRIAVVTLPPHSSDRTQPLDVSVFGPLKHYANTAVAKRAKMQAAVDNRFEKLTGYDAWEAIRTGFKDAFTSGNIVSGFRNTGFCPYDAGKLVSPRIRRGFYEESLATPQEFMQLKRKLVSEFKRFGLSDAVMKRGFVDTTVGIELTRFDVMNLVLGLELDRKEQV